MYRSWLLSDIWFTPDTQYICRARRIVVCFFFCISQSDCRRGRAGQSVRQTVPLTSREWRVHDLRNSVSEFPRYCVCGRCVMWVTRSGRLRNQPYENKINTLAHSFGTVMAPALCGILPNEQRRAETAHWSNTSRTCYTANNFTSSASPTVPV